MKAASQSPRPSLLACALLILLFQGILYLPLLLGDQVFLTMSPLLATPWARAGISPEAVQDQGGSDKVSFTLPNLHYWREAVLHDPSALFWNPGILCGYPFLSTLDTFALYPLNVVYLIWQPVSGLLVSALLHGFLASFLALLVLRKLGLGGTSALLGGLLFGSGGWFLVHLDVMNFAQAATWVPLMVWGALDLLKGGRLWGMAALAFGYALSFLGGMPQITFIGLFGTGLIALALSPQAGSRRGAKGLCGSWGLGLAALLLGVGLTAPQLLPTLQAAGRSERLRVSPKERRRLAARPLELSGFLAPELLGSPSSFDRERREKSGAIPPGTTEQNFPLARAAGLPKEGASLMERVFYPGGAGLLLMLLAVFGPRRRLAAGGALLLLVGFLATLQTPLQSALMALPMFAFGNPRRFLFLAVMGSSLLAALGCEALILQRLKRGSLVAPALLAGGLGIWLLLVQAAPQTVAASLLLSPAALAALKGWVTQTSLPGWLFFTAALGVVVIQRRLPRFALAALLFLLLLGDMSLFQESVNPGQPQREIRFESHLGAWLKQHGRDGSRVVRYQDGSQPLTALPPMPPNMGLLAGIRDVQGGDGLLPRENEDLMNLIQPGLTWKHHVIGAVTQKASLRSPVLDLAGVRYVMATAVLDLPRVFVDAREQVAVYERPHPLPRFSFPRELLVCPDRASLEARLQAGDYRPAKMLLASLEEARRLLLALGRSPPRAGQRIPLTQGKPTVKLLAARPTFMRLHFHTLEGGILHISESFHEGWRARLANGRKLPVAQVNRAFMGIPLPAGSGILELSFEPRRFLQGCWLGAISLGLLLSFAGLEALRSRPKQEAS